MVLLHLLAGIGEVLHLDLDREPEPRARSATSLTEKVSTNWLKMRSSPGPAGFSTERRTHCSVSRRSR